MSRIVKPVVLGVAAALASYAAVRYWPVTEPVVQPGPETVKVIREFTSALDSSGPARPAEAPALEELFKKHNYRDLEASLKAAGMKNHEQALSWADKLVGAQAGAAREAILAGWYLTDPRGAIDWAKANDTHFFLSDVFVKSALELGDIPLALEGLAVTGYVDGYEPIALFSGFAKNDVNQALAAALAASPEIHEQAFLGVLSVLGAQDPTRALNVAAANATDPDEQRNYMKATMDAWIAAAGPDAVRAYLGQQTPSKALDGGYQALAVAATSAADANAAIASITDPMIQWSAEHNLFVRTFNSAPDMASQVAAANITNQHALVHQLGMSIPFWGAQDPAAATAFINSLTISATDKQALLKLVPGNP